MTARLLLAPLSLPYCAGMRLRNSLYDVGLLRSIRSEIPVISVGNLSVGGTGKTPVTAWLADEVSRLGRVPAIVLRGYGGDEVEVHRRLSPNRVVVANPDRVEGLRAAMGLGADLGILDDAFQHRAAARDLDIVLIDAERWHEGGTLCLPAGPLREGKRGLRRAGLIAVTAKSASQEQVHGVVEAVRRIADAPVAVLRLEAAGLSPVTGDEASISLEQLRGERVLAVSGIGNPEAFEEQVRALTGDGGGLVEGRRYADHHEYTRADVAEIERLASGKDRVVCTLKDAVKLGPIWPRKARELWYVSQRVRPVMGWEQGEALLSRLVVDRTQHSP